LSPKRSVDPAPPYDVRRGVLAQPHLGPDESISPHWATRASTFGARRSDFGRCPADSPASCPASLRPRCRSECAPASARARTLPARMVAIIRPRGVKRSKAMPFSATRDTRLALRPMRAPRSRARDGFGWGSVATLRFRPPALVRLPVAETKSAVPCEVRGHTSGIHQSQQGLMRTIRLRNPDKCVGCHMSPT
jgi:hypothetical protein